MIPRPSLRRATLAIAAIFLLADRNMDAHPPHLPVGIAAKDLNGLRVELPRDLPGRPYTLLLIAFEREQQEILDGWIEGMDLRGSGIAWLELPVIENPGVLGRWFIDTGMRSGIPKKGDRARVVTVYTDKAAFLASLGLPGEKDVHIVVVNPAGERVFLISGPFNEVKGNAVKKILSHAP